MDGNRPDFTAPGATPHPQPSPTPDGLPHHSAPPPTGPPPVTSSPGPRRRTPLIIAIVVGALVVLAGIGAVVWWTMLRTPGGGDGGSSPVTNIDQAPEITWTVELPDNALQLQWSPVGLDHALLFSSAIDPADPSPVILVDLTDGEVQWEVDLTDAAGAAEWVVGQDLPGTDFVSVNLYTTDGQSPSTLLLVDRRSGEVHRSQELPLGRGLLTTPSGNVYVANWMDSRIDRVAGIDQLDEVEWSMDIPSFEGGDFNVGITEFDGHALYGRTELGGGMPGYDWPLYFAAAGLDDGSVPPWAPSLDMPSSFIVLDGVFVQMQQADTTVAVGVDPRGEELWRLDNFTGVVMPLDDMMFLLDHQTDHTAITRYDPQRGTPMWDEPARLPVGTALAMVDDKVVALTTSQTPQAVTLNPTTGAQGHRLTFPNSGFHQYFVGSDRLYISTRPDPGAELTLIAQPVDRPGSVWTATFPASHEAAHVGRHLVLIDLEGRSMSGLGTR